MARIRTIKPEFWTDEKMSLLDPVTRLVFLGLISMADDAGRLLDNVKLLDGQLFPNTDDTCRESLETLARLSRITRYRTASGQSVIQITKWSDHQKVDHPNKHVLPGPDQAAIMQSPAPNGDGPNGVGHSREAREEFASASRDPLATTPDLGPRTNDLGPTTPDRAGAGDEFWVDSVSEQWRKARGGTAPREAIARDLAPLREQYGDVVFRSAVMRFLASDQARFGPSFLATNFGDYLNDRPRSPPGQQSKNDRIRAQQAILRGAS